MLELFLFIRATFIPSLIIRLEIGLLYSILILPGRFIFILPVEGITTGVFGTKRFYNGIEGSYHNGYDIAADIGTPIVAPSSGKIILTGDFFYNGKTIYLDHGRGLKSIMIHLDEILVENHFPLQ